MEYKNAGSKCSWTITAITNVRIIDPKLPQNNRLSFDKQVLLDTDPVFKYEGFNNPEYACGRVAELGHAKLNPTDVHLNKDKEMSRKDFINKYKQSIDIKSVKNKNNVLRIGKRDVDNDFANCADIFWLYDVDDSDPKVFIVEPYGYVSKENIQKWFNEKCPRLHMNKFYLMERQYLTKIK